MKEKSILSRIKSNREDKKLTRQEREEKARQERLQQMRKEREAQDQISSRLFEVDTALRTYEDKFQKICRSELKKAGIDGKNGKKDPRKYSKIGVAFYCSQIVKEARQRIAEQKDDYELQSTINGMMGALESIRQLDGQIGTWNVKKLKKEAEHLSASSGKGDEILMKTLDTLKKLENPQEEKTMLENLVDYEIIDRWITDPNYAEECWKSGEGTLTSVDQILDLPETGAEESFTSSSDAISNLEKMLQNLN